MMLNACFDLQYSPPTYDSVSFVLAAELERIKRGCEALTIHILPGPKGGFRLDKLPPFTIEERQHMRDKIVVPMARLLPSCVECVVRNDRVKPENGFGYGESKYSLPFLLQAARQNVYPLRAEPKQDGSYVTITLRETQYWPTRNSNLNEWLRVAIWLREQGHRVIVVRDTERANAKFGDFESSPHASRDLLTRASLYAGARLNLFVNNGPAWLCLFMAAPCLIFKLTSPAAPCTNDEYFASAGFRRGESWPNLKPRQLVSWMPDHTEHIIAAIKNIEL